MAEYKNEGKAPLELLSPSFLREVAKALEVGDKKHKDNHYLDPKVKIPLSKVIGATMRHLTQLQEEDIDEETQLYHTGLAGAGLQIIHTIISDRERFGGRDDRRFIKSNNRLGGWSFSAEEIQRCNFKISNGGNTGIPD